VDTVFVVAKEVCITCPIVGMERWFNFAKFPKKNDLEHTVTTATKRLG